MNKTSGLPAGEVTFNGVPFPEDGSMFGWVHDGTVTAVVCLYTDPEPIISVMPLAGLPETGWPPICDFGGWFWDAYQAGRIVDLAPLIAGTHHTAYWVDTTEAIGSGCVAVVGDLVSPDGWTLPRGVYAYYRVLRDHRALADDLLGAPGKVDLAPRFRKF